MSDENETIIKKKGVFIDVKQLSHYFLPLSIQKIFLGSDQNFMGDENLLKKRIKASETVRFVMPCRKVAGPELEGAPIKEEQLKFHAKGAFYYVQTSVGGHFSPTDRRAVTIEVEPPEDIEYSHQIEVCYPALKKDTSNSSAKKEEHLVYQVDMLTICTQLSERELDQVVAVYPSSSAQLMIMGDFLFFRAGVALFRRK
jgi:hypothetical protein